MTSASRRLWYYNIFGARRISGWFSRVDSEIFATLLLFQREQGLRGLHALGLRTGLTHMEWFRRPEGAVAISEVAARPPGAQFTSLLSYAHDIDMYAAWARLEIFGTFAPPERRYSVGAAYLRGQGDGAATRN